MPSVFLPFFNANLTTWTLKKIIAKFKNAKQLFAHLKGEGKKCDSTIITFLVLWRMHNALILMVELIIIAGSD